MEGTRVYRSTDMGSDHHLVCATVKLRLRKIPTRKSDKRTKYDTSKLKDEKVRNTFKITLRNRFQVLKGVEDEVERDFGIIKKTFLEVAETVLGRPQKKNKPWISGESWSLIDEGQQINKKILGTRSERVKGQLRKRCKDKDKEVKRSLKSDKKKWLQGIASGAEEVVCSQHMKNLQYMV